MLLRKLSLLVLLLLLGTTPAVAAGPSISGFLLADDDGSPVEGAEVSLLDYLNRDEIAEHFDEPPEPVAKTRSDADGYYRLEAPEVGFYLVLVEAPGKRSLIRSLEPLLESQTLPSASLADGQTLTIRVKDPDGKAVADARVVLTAQPERERRNRMRRRARSGWLLHRQRQVTDDKGQAKMVISNKETLTFEVAADGLAPLELKRSAKDLGSTIDATLAAGEIVPLRLLDASGRALPDVLVRFGDHVPLARSNEEGRLSLAIDPGSDQSARLVADAEGLHGVLSAEALWDEMEEQDSTQEITWRLEEPNRVSGTVVDSSRRPVAGALVWTARRPDTATRTDNRGSYEMPLTGDRQWLGAAAAGYQRAQSSLEKGATEAPTLVLEPAASLSGRVLDRTGEPIGGAEIEIHEISQQRRFRPRGQSVSTPDGRFNVTGLEVEKGFELKARARGYITQQQSLEPLEIGEVRSGVEIRLEPALVAVGQVIDEQERPVAGAQVEMAPQPKSADFRAMFRQMREGGEPNTANTNAKGLFRIENLDPGTYRLIATAGGFAPVRVPGLELEEGAGEVDLGTVVVVPGVELAGRVTGPEGQALAGVEVEASPDASGVAAMIAHLGAEPMRTTTDTGGRFVLEDLLPEQALKIALTKEGWAAEAADVTTGTEKKTIDLVMQPAGRLVVEVRDPSDQPVARASVTAKPSGGGFGIRPARDRSDASGRAEIEDLLPGRYDIEVNAEGYRPSSRAGVEVTPGGQTLDITLGRGLSLVGTVYSPSGAPVSSAFVRIEDSVRTISFGSRHDRTDGDGRFTIEGLDPGPQEVRVRHEDFGEVVKRVEVSEGQAPVEIRYSGGAPVSGMVLDSTTGEAVIGATVELRDASNGGPIMGRGQLRADTGPDGSFTIKNVPSGNYSPVASHADFANATGESLEVGEAAVSGVVLEMGGGETILGRVIGVEFDQLTEVTLVAMSPEGGFLAGTLDYEGRFRLERLAPGDWVVQASTPDGRQARERVQLEAGDGEVEVEIEFGGGLTVRGTIMRAGEAVPGLTVRASNREKFIFTEGRSDLEGRFEVQGLEPGTYTVQLLRNRGEVLLEEQRTLDGDDEWFFDLQIASVAGRIVDESGRGLPGVAVGLRLASAEPTRGRFGLNANEVSSDSLGAFEFGDIAAGSYRLIATKAGYGQAEVTFEITDAPRRDIEIVLERSAGVSLQVFRASGGHPSRVNVAVLDAASQIVEGGSRPVDDGGLLHLDSLPAGDFTLLVAEPGGASAEKAIRSPGDGGALTLPVAGVLLIEMPQLFAEGERAKIEIHRADGSPYRAVEEFTGRSWLRGSEHRQTLPVGSYTVHIEASNEQRWQYPVTITAGGEARLSVP